VTRDPIGLLGGLDLYQYVQGDPTTGHDVSGLKWNYRLCPWLFFVSLPLELALCRKKPDDKCPSDLLVKNVINLACSLLPELVSELCTAAAEGPAPTLVLLQAKLSSLSDQYDCTGPEPLDEKKCEAIAQLQLLANNAAQSSQ
jgi:hypothetical protein